MSKYRKLKGKAGEEGKENGKNAAFGRFCFKKYYACRKLGYLHRVSDKQLIIAIA